MAFKMKETDGNPMQKTYANSFEKKNTSYKLTNDNSTTPEKVLEQQKESI